MSLIDKRKPKPSLRPQNVNSMCWYYEYKGRIEVVIDLYELAKRGLAAPQKTTWIFHIAKSKLKASLARMA